MTQSTSYFTTLLALYLNNSISLDKQYTPIQPSTCLDIFSPREQQLCWVLSEIHFILRFPSWNIKIPQSLTKRPRTFWKMPVQQKIFYLCRLPPFKIFFICRVKVISLCAITRTHGCIPKQFRWGHTHISMIVQLKFCFVCVLRLHNSGIK